MNNQSLGYDPKDATSIWQYSAGLLGHTLREFIDGELEKEYTIIVVQRLIFILLE